MVFRWTQAWVAAGLIAISAMPARACGPLPFDIYVAQTQAALASKAAPEADRSLVARLLAEARDGPGPKWHKARQRALNKARARLGMAPVLNAPLEELDDSDRVIALRGQARQTLAIVDALSAKKDKASLQGAGFETKRAELSVLFDHRDWEGVIAKGQQLEFALGAPPPPKCAAEA